MVTFGDERLPIAFWERVLVEDATGCWLWCGNRYSNGYGRMSLDGRERLIHRLAYESLVGPIPAGLHLDHLCRNKFCANPVHVEPVTPAENIQRWSRTVTHCPKGHEYTPANARLKKLYRTSATGEPYFGRDCRACDRERQAARRAARKASAS